MVDLRALHPWPKQLLRAAGMPTELTPRTLRQFQHMVGAPSVADEQTITVHYRDRSVSSVTRSRAEHATVRLLAWHLDLVSAWAAAERTGTSIFEIAERAGVPEALVYVALHGPNAQRRAQVAAEVLAIWEAGGTRVDVAAAIGVTPSQVGRWTRAAGISLAPRLSVQAFMAALGCSVQQARRLRAQAFFPAPDGRTPGGLAWWWPATIWAWRDEQIAAGALLPCPECGALMTSPRGVSIHRAAAHPPHA